MKNKEEIQKHLDLLESHSKLNDDSLKKYGIKSVKLIHEVLTPEPKEPQLIITYVDGFEEKMDGWKFVNDKLEFLIK